MALGRQALQLLRDIKGSLDDINGGRFDAFEEHKKREDRERDRPWYLKRPGTQEKLDDEGNHGPLPGIPARFMPFFERAFLASLQGMAGDIEDDGRFQPIEHAKYAYYLAEAAVGVLREAEQEHADMHAREADARRQREVDEAMRKAEQEQPAAPTPTPAAVKRALRKVPRAKSPGQELASKIAKPKRSRRS